MLKILDKEKITEIRTWAFALTILLSLLIFFGWAFSNLQIWNTFKYEFRHIGFVNLLPTTPPTFILLIIIMPVIYFIANKYSKNETIKNIVIINAILLPTLLFFQFVLYEAGDPDLYISYSLYGNCPDSAIYSPKLSVLTFYIWVLFLILLIFSLLSPIVDNVKTRRKFLVNSLAISFGLIFLLFSYLLSNFIALTNFAIKVDEAKEKCIFETMKVYPVDKYPELYDPLYFFIVSENELAKRSNAIYTGRQHYEQCLLSELPISEYEMAAYSLGFFSIIMAIACLILSKSVFKRGRLRNELIGKGAMAASVIFWFVSYLFFVVYVLKTEFEWFVNVVILLILLAIWFALYYLIYWLASRSFLEEKKKADKK
ncbi:MAG: hypothetical protein QW400_04595 [Candidatus Diapherotrites archaeon]